MKHLKTNKYLIITLTFILIVGCIVGCSPAKTTVTVKSTDAGKKTGTISQTFGWDKK